MLSLSRASARNHVARPLLQIFVLNPQINPNQPQAYKILKLFLPNTAKFVVGGLSGKTIIKNKATKLKLSEPPTTTEKPFHPVLPSAAWISSAGPAPINSRCCLNSGDAKAGFTLSQLSTARFAAQSVAAGVQAFQCCTQVRSK